MNGYFLAAAALAVIGVVWHGVGGERSIVRALDADKLAPSFFGDGDITKRFLRGCWHLFTVHLAAIAVTFFVLASTERGPATAIVSRFVAFEFLAFLAIYLGLAGARPVMFVRAPQWLFFSAMAALAWLGG